MINFAVINLKSFMKNLIKVVFVLAFAFGMMNVRRDDGTSCEKV